MEHHSVRDGRLWYRCKHGGCSIQIDFPDPHPARIPAKPPTPQPPPTGPQLQDTTDL